MAPPLTPDQLARINENKAPNVVVVVSIFMGLSTIAVALRFAARASRHMGFGMDDWLAVGALVGDHSTHVTDDVH